MTTREKELIAIGVSYAINCDPCIRYHWLVGKEAGVTGEDAREAMRVAQIVQDASKLRMDDVAETLFGNMETGEAQKKPEVCGCQNITTSSETGCGC